MGLSTFLVPKHKFGEAALEMLITLAIILNAIIATRNEWHRRWLDYRQLAERLRPMRSLKLLGIAPPSTGNGDKPRPAALDRLVCERNWRGMGCPAELIDRQRADRLATAIADHEVAPQVTYHQRNALLIAKLDERLGKLGLILFATTPRWIGCHADRPRLRVQIS